MFSLPINITICETNPEKAPSKFNIQWVWLLSMYIRTKNLSSKWTKREKKRYYSSFVDEKLGYREIKSKTPISIQSKIKSQKSGSKQNQKLWAAKVKKIEQSA